MIIYAEWICTRCQNLHRVRFNVMVSFSKPVNSRINWKSQTSNGEGIEIDDIAYSSKIKRRRKSKGGGSKIHCKPMTKTTQLFKVLKEYMKEFYSMKPDSLKLGVCID